MLMISIGKNKQDFIGELKKILALLALLIGTKAIAMNFWELRKDCVLLHLPIDAILHLPKL